MDREETKGEQALSAEQMRAQLDGMLAEHALREAEIQKLRALLGEAEGEARVDHRRENESASGDASLKRFSGVAPFFVGRVVDGVLSSYRFDPRAIVGFQLSDERKAPLSLYDDEEARARLARHIQNPTQSFVAFMARAGERLEYVHRWGVFSLPDGSRVLLAFDDTDRDQWLAKMVGQARELERVNRELQAQNEVRESSEKALLASEAKNRTIVRTIADALIITDEEFRVESANPVTERLFRLDPDQLYGVPIHELLQPYPEDHETEEDEDWEQMTPLGIRREVLGRRPDGSTFPVQISVGTYLLGYNQRYTVLIHDISRLKEVEEALLEAKEAAESATAVKSAFLANMSHEIRTPMNGIMGVVHLMKETPLSEEQREYLETIDNSARGLLTIINDILDFSKIEAGKLVIESIPMDLRVNLEETLDLLAAKSEAKDLELLLRYPADAPRMVLGDPGRIRQVVLNLAGNAIKFTDSGHVLVEVNCLGRMGDRARLSIRVADTGIGIPAAKLDDMFNKFTQADSSTTRQYGGTGLGLAICRELVHLMGGDIHVDSVYGEGSEFWFEIDFEVSREAPPVAEPPKGGRAVVYEPRALSREITVSELAALGIETAASHDVLEVVRLLEEVGDEPVACLVSYHRDDEGYSRLLKLLSERRPSKCMIVLVAAVDARHELDRLRENFVIDHVIYRPLRLRQLGDVFREETGRQKAPAAPSAKPVSRDRKKTDESDSIAGLPVLLVEDNPINQKVAKRLLERLQCQVTVAVNGQDALDKMDGSRFAIIFMDVQMPVLNGYEATERIRERETPDAKTPVVAMTANAMEGDRERCLSAGMDDYISKPINPRMLGELVTKWTPADWPAR